MGESLQTDRIFFIDIARFYAMALVFYGHFIEELMLLKNSAAASHYKFVYSFHMVLFIVLAGYVAKENETPWGVRTFIKNRFFSRFLPFMFFTLLMMVPPIFFDGKFFNLVLPSVGGYAEGVVNTIFGLPFFCVPSWFLLLIIGVEWVHFSAFRFLKDSNIKVLMAIVLFYVVGYLFNLKLDVFNPLKKRTVGWNYFFIHEALTLYAFYLAGIYLRRKQVFTKQISRKVLFLGAVVTFVIVLYTYKLNSRPFNFYVYDAVVIMFASHGHMLLFPLTALAGCAMIFLVAKMTRTQKTIIWMGQNTLILMCLNGVFYHYVNGPAASWVLANLPHSSASVFGAGIVMTAASMTLCIPVIYVLDKYIPQLVGKPKFNGPLLRNFI